MTRLKARFKIDVKHLSKVERDLAKRGLIHLSELDVFNKTANSIQRDLNAYERYLMGKRASDPILGGINTAQWRVKFDLFMTRGDIMYGKYIITNVQKPYTYYYMGYNKSFTVGRGARKKTYGAKPWHSSGTVGNLAAIRYATPDTNAYVVQHVFPRGGKSIMFYSHLHNAIIFRRHREYSSGGHERYTVHIDNIIMDNIDRLPSDVVSYAPKSINLLTPKK